MKANLILHYVARAWSIASFLFILAFVVGGEESMRPTAAEMVGLSFFPIGVIVGFIIAWRRELVGALVSLCSLAASYTWLLARNGHLTSFPGGSSSSPDPLSSSWPARFLRHAIGGRAPREQLHFDAATIIARKFAVAL